MSDGNPKENAKEKVIAAYKRRRRIKTAADAGDVPYSTAYGWLKQAGLLIRDEEKLSRGFLGHRRESETAAENLVRVDRDPCPKCGTRKDAGCRHFSKQPEVQRPMTDRERAWFIWRKSV